MSSWGLPLTEQKVEEDMSTVTVSEEYSIYPTLAGNTKVTMGTHAPTPEPPKDNIHGYAAREAKDEYPDPVAKTRRIG